MTTSRRAPLRPAGPAIVLLAAALALGACTSTDVSPDPDPTPTATAATPTASPSPTPTPTPTPEPTPRYTNEPDDELNGLLPEAVRGAPLVVAPLDEFALTPGDFGTAYGEIGARFSSLVLAYVEQPRLSLYAARVDGEPVRTEDLEPHLATAGRYVGIAGLDPEPWELVEVGGSVAWTRPEDNATAAGTTIYTWSSGEFVFLLIGVDDQANRALVRALPGEPAPTPRPTPSPSPTADEGDGASPTATDGRSMRLAEWADRVRHSLWFIPTLCTLAGGALALVLIWVSAETDASGADVPFLFAAGVDGARAMLQAIATSIITVAGVVFSITIVALQLTSSQFSPRVLRSFLRDRSQQLVLGTFMGTFTFTLVVLRSIRSEDDDVDAFVPVLAVSASLLLTLVSLGMLIYFIHHISVRIQVTSIIAGVADETIGTIQRLSGRWRADDRHPWHPATGSAAGGDGTDEVLVPARASGYVQLIDLKGLMETAREHDGRLRLLVAPGTWLQDGLPCAAFAPASSGEAGLDRLTAAVTERLALGHERTMTEDVAFGIQQLVDIAIKALSPSINDPTTAMNCIDRLVQVLLAAGAGPDAPRAFADGDGTIRLEIPYPDFEQLVDLSFDQVRHYGATAPAVVVHLARGLDRLRPLPRHRHAVLRRHGTRLAEAAEAIALDDERRRTLEAIGPLLT